MAKPYPTKSERVNRMIDSLKCRTDAADSDEVIRKAVIVYNLLGTAIEQGHKVVIGNEPINLMEFHLLPPSEPPTIGPRLAKPDEEEPAKPQGRALSPEDLGMERVQ